MKKNTTLQSLNLGGKQKVRKQDKRIVDIAINKHQQAVNSIGAEEARTLSEALKINTTLSSFYLGSAQKQHQGKAIPKKKAAPTTILNRQLHWSGRSKSTERSIENQHNTPITASVLSSKKKVRKMDELQTLSTTNTNKQATRLVMKEQEH